MKKFLFVAVCLALSLSSCIKDGESASIEQIRVNYAEKLAAESALLQAQAEATKVIAEADAAIKLAEAEALKIQNQIADIQRQLLEVELEFAKAQLEVRLAELEAELAEVAIRMEAAAAEAERAALAAKAALNEAKLQYINSVTNLEAAEAARLVGFFNAYAEAVEATLQAKQELSGAKTYLAMMQNDLLSAEEYRDAVAAEADENIAEYQKNIAIYEKAIEILKKYQTSTTEEISAAMTQLELDYMDLSREANKVTEESNALAEELDVQDPSNHALYQYLASNPLNLVTVQLIEGTPWFGYSVLNDDPLTATIEYDFFPVYVCYYYEEYNEYYELVQYGYDLYAEESILVEKTYEDQVFAYEYNELVGLGEYDAEAVKAYAEYVKNNQADFLSFLEQVETQLAELEAQVPYFKGATEKAMAWAEADAVYQALYKDTTVESYIDYAAGVIVTTTYGAYKAADRAYNGGIDESGWFPVEIQGAKQVADAAKAKVEAAEDAVLVAETALADAKKALTDAGADATDEQKAAVAEAEKALEAAELALTYAEEEQEIADKKADAAKAEFEAAQKALEAAVAKVEPAKEAVEVAKHAYDLYYMEFASHLGVDQYAGYWATDETTYEEYYVEVDAASTYEMWQYQYDGWMENVQYQKDSYARYQAEYEALIDGCDTEAAEFLATVAELEEGVADYIKAYNELYAKAVDAALESEIAWYKVDVVAEQYNALAATYTEAENMENEIAAYENAIESANEAIKSEEDRKVEAANITSVEEAVAFAEEALAFAEEKVAYCEEREAEAKAALDAADAE